MFSLEECKLRSMVESDLAIVLKWRNSDRIRPMMYTDHVISQEEHRAWFDGLPGRNDKRHLVFEIQQMPTGVVNITGISETHRRCTWGFYIGREDAPRRAGLAMGICALDYMFNSLKMNKVTGEVLAFNDASFQYHLKLGFTEEGRLARHVWKGGQTEDVIILAQFADRWDDHRKGLLNIVEQAVAV